jgi:hypothetical protein
MDEIVDGIHPLHGRGDGLRLQCIAFHYVYVISPGLRAEAIGVPHETADRVALPEETGHETAADIPSGTRDENSLRG